MIEQWIRESNLIEGIDDPIEDAISSGVWNSWRSVGKVTGITIFNVHRGIMFNQQPYIAGEYRHVNVSVGGRHCPEWEVVSSLVSKWLDKYCFTTRGLNGKQIKEAHIEFEKIHPFQDGNGRTGRMIMNLQRVSNGLKPLCIKASERWQYYDWFR